MKSDQFKDLISITDGNRFFYVTLEVWNNIVRRQELFFAEDFGCEKGISAKDGISRYVSVPNAGMLSSGRPRADGSQWLKWTIAERDPIVPEGCPKCGCSGEFIRMALCCPTHGVFAGI